MKRILRLEDRSRANLQLCPGHLDRQLALGNTIMQVASPSIWTTTCERASCQLRLAGHQPVTKRGPHVPLSRHNTFRFNSHGKQSRRCRGLGLPGLIGGYDII
eukprot:scaffold18186_cov37-Prasinocladus_malaysianus.AAC.2